MFSLIISIFFIAIILMFIKTRALNFKYSIFWLMFGLIMVVLSLNRGVTIAIANFVKVSSDSNFLIMMVIIFVLISVLYIMVAISQLQKKITRLVQEVAVIKSIQEKGDSK